MTAPTGWWCPMCGHTQAAPVADQPDPEPIRMPTDEEDPVCNRGQWCAFGWTHWHRMSAHPGERNARPLTAPVGVPVGDDTNPEAKCEECGRPNIVWFAPSPLWNAAVRTTPDSPDLMLCPSCFAIRYETVTGDQPTAWVLTPEVLAPEAPEGVPVGDDTPAPTVCPKCGEPPTTNKWCLACVPTSDEDTPETGRWTVDEHGDIYFHHPDQMEPFGVNGMSPVGEALADLVRRAGAAPDLTALAQVVEAYDVRLFAPHHPDIPALRAAVLQEARRVVAALVREDTTDG
jgi:hypothetical protein